MRLDSYLVENEYFSSRNKASEAIKRGEVFVGGKAVLKPSYEVIEGVEIAIKAEKTFVSVGGYKLDKALDSFNIDVKDLTFADIGASTGGFTDVLLQRGVKRVFCVDVGENLLDEKISSDNRVVVMDNCNARNLKKADFPCEIQGIVVDCSFISLKLLIGVLKDLICKKGVIIALVKPQFECGKDKLGKSGILLSSKEQLRVLCEIIEFCKMQNLVTTNLCFSPINAKKNIEYLLEIKFEGEQISFETVENIVNLAKKCKENL